MGEQLEVTREVIFDLGGADKPVILAYNKCDVGGAVLGVAGESSVRISAKSGDGIDELLMMIEEVVHRTKRAYKLLIPYMDQSVVSSLYNSYTVKSMEYLDNGIEVEVVLDTRGAGYYAKYLLE